MIMYAYIYIYIYIYIEREREISVGNNDIRPGLRDLGIRVSRVGRESVQVSLSSSVALKLKLRT